MTILHENDELDNGPSSEMLAFYNDHCSTSRNHIILVTAIFPPCDCDSPDCQDNEESQISNVFSSFDAVQDWVEALDGDAAILLMPLVVDDPMFGSEALN